METTMIEVSMPQDEDLLLKSWRVNKSVQRDGVPYRYRPTRKGYRLQMLHRVVAARMIAPKRLTRKMHVAFRDGKPWNCTRENLVITDRYKSQDIYGQARARTKTSPYRGVYVDRRVNKLHAKHTYRVVDPATQRSVYKVKHLGFYDLGQGVEAAKARDAFVHQLDPTIKLNFPEDYVKVG